MNEREDLARDQGRLKVFLHPEEITLILAALALMKTDLSLADEQSAKLSMPDIQAIVPKGLFQSLDPVLDAMSENLMSQSRADLRERGDMLGEQKFEETLHESWERHSKMLELMQLVLLASYSKGEEDEGPQWLNFENPGQSD